ncbi:Ribophorin I [Jimgerdemannia flammicorona]|uniref:Dolichyl-diphosphooligosaccharide--protein glycosyltransferase subunit 1 n=1 Tax=Jimgerdemannia flammicorona TaxID=994334 RepID=A0A433DH46_9FUNG|nr:Ribophorin I [Jimgerdemannia flammicorona]
MSWSLNKRLPALLACLLLLTVAALADHPSTGIAKSPLKIPQNFVNVHILRNLDLSSAVVRELTTVVVKNVANDAQSEYFVPIPEQIDAHVAIVEASNKKSGTQLEVKKDSFDSEKLIQYYKVILQQPLQPQEKDTITLKVVYTHVLSSLPKHIPQVAKQFLVYTGNVFVFSAYTSEKQKTVVKLPTTTVVTYTNNEGTVTKTGNLINYGPFNSISPHQHTRLYVHYEGTKPLLTFSRVRRELEVSHWGGNLAVEEHFELKHDGARLKTQFSRVEFQQSAHVHAQTAVLKSLTFTLPAGASDPYYRDEIGNVSTSNFRSTPRGATLELRPRYPLYGGWNYTWYHGYNLPLDAFARFNKEKDVYVLNVPFLKTVTDATVDRAIIKVLLPEGAINVKVTLPFAVDSETHGKHLTYLDTTGRYAVVLEKHNVVDEHAQNFQITYEYPPLELLRKPLAASAAFFALFVISAVLSRVEFRITGKVR